MRAILKPPPIALPQASEVGKTRTSGRSLKMEADPDEFRAARYGIGLTYRSYSIPRNRESPILTASFKRRAINRQEAIGCLYGNFVSLSSSPPMI